VYAVNEHAERVQSLPRLPFRSRSAGLAELAIVVGGGGACPLGARECAELASARCSGAAPACGRRPAPRARSSMIS